MTPIEQIREALEEAQKRIDDMKSCLHDSGIYESELDDTYSDIADALSLLSSMEGQTKTEPVAWMTKDGRIDALNVSSKALGGKRWGPQYFGEHWCIPLYTHPSPSVPCISVENAMEAFKEWCKNDMKNSPVEDGFESEWKFPDLRERLTKAAK